MKLIEGGYAPQSRTHRDPLTMGFSTNPRDGITYEPPKDPYGTTDNVNEDFQLSLRKDDIFKAILASRVYGDARTHERGMERVFEMFNKYFEEN